MRCFYCARQERLSSDGVAVAICKRCGGGICLEHLCEVRHDRRHAGMLGSTPGQNVELLCLGCAGVTPAETKTAASTGRRAGRESAGSSSVSAPSHPGHRMRGDGELLWSDPASVVVAAESYLEHLRDPRVSAGAGDAYVGRRSGAHRQWWGSRGWRWLDARMRRLTRRASDVQAQQR